MTAAVDELAGDAAAFALVDSVQLFGSMGFCSVTQTGSAWVVSTLPSGVKQTRLIGDRGRGCGLQGLGELTGVRLHSLRGGFRWRERL